MANVFIILLLLLLANFWKLRHLTVPLDAALIVIFAVIYIVWVQTIISHICLSALIFLLTGISRILIIKMLQRFILTLHSDGITTLIITVHYLIIKIINLKYINKINFY